MLVPLMALTAAVLHRSTVAVNRRPLGMLVASAAIGVPVGARLVGRPTVAKVRTGVGALSVSYAATSLLPPHPSTLPRSDAVVGMLELLASTSDEALNPD